MGRELRLDWRVDCLGINVVSIFCVEQKCDVAYMKESNTLELYNYCMSELILIATSNSC